MQKILHTPPHTQLRYDFFIVPLYAERCVIGIIKNGNLFRQGCRLHSEIGWVERRPPLESKMFAQSLWCKMPVFQKVAMREGGGPLPLWPSPPGTFHSRNTNSPFRWFWILTVRVYPMFFPWELNIPKFLVV